MRTFDVSTNYQLWVAESETCGFKCLNRLSEIGWGRVGGGGCNPKTQGYSEQNMISAIPTTKFRFDYIRSGGQSNQELLLLRDGIRNIMFSR